MKSILLRLLPHGVAVIIFVIISVSFFSLVGDEYALKQSDIQHVMGMGKEINDYRMIHNGEEALWSDNMFGGMPAYQTGVRYKSNLLRPLDTIMKLGLNGPIGTLFMCMLGFYIFCLCVRVNPWLSIAAAISFGLSTINILYLGAGHTSKVNAIAYMAPALGGLLLAYRGKWILGSAVFALFMGLHFAANHLQMTYYLMFLLGTVVISEVVRLLINKEISYALKTSALLIIGGILALMPNAGSLLTTYEYSKLTTRGKSELTITKEGSEKGAADSKGLKPEYILEYNMAAGEPWAMVIPNAKGGSSMVALADNKEAMQVADRQAREQLKGFPQYWGEQGASAGAFYFGAAMMFLFLLALIFVKDTLKWPFLILSLLAIFLAMKNMHGLNDFFIHHFPMYNKFRDSKMMLVLIQIMAPALAIIFIDQLIKTEITPKLKKSLWIGAGALFVIFVFVMASPNVTGPFISTAEVEYLDGAREQYKGQSQYITMIDSIEDSLVEVRHFIFQQDAQRSLLWIVVAIGLIVAASLKKLNIYVAAGILTVVVAIDMWGISSRYMNEDKAKNPQTGKNEYRHYAKIEDMAIPYSPDNCDLFILEKEKGNVEDFDGKALQLLNEMKSNKPYSLIKNQEKLNYAAEFGALNLNTDYRVLLANPAVFSEASMPYYHKSIGGYHAAKLKIYQEMIDFHLQDELAALGAALQSRSNDTVASALQHLPVLNMLNTRYIKYNGEAPPLDNSKNAFGNAWFVSDIDFVPTADEEILSVGKTDLRKSAIVRETFKDVARPASGLDSSASIVLTEYATKYLSFKSKSNVEAPAIFSEIYYPEGWICRIDGNEVPVFKANYILRGVQIPAGEHTVEWSFEPASYKRGNTINWIGSFSLLFFVVGIFGWNIKTGMADNKKAA